MNTHTEILVVGHDHMLLHTRKLILGTYFQVKAAGRLSEAAMLLSKEDVNLVVCCDTLTDSECCQIARMVRDHDPRPGLLWMTRPAGLSQDELSSWRVMQGTGPMQLLRECGDLLGVDVRGKQRLVS